MNRVALLSAANCIHAIRWANGLASKGLDVHLITLHHLTHDLDERVKMHELPMKTPYGYLGSAVALTKLLRSIRPDILNAHYATGYGFLAQMSMFRPLLLSVYGSDVYDFPEKSPLHRMLLMKNLRSATAIASTSKCMARKTAETYRHEHVFITPFGVDERLFVPDVHRKKNDRVVIGTVKTLKDKYGIDTLIEAFSIVLKTLADEMMVTLEITGDGPDLGSLRQLATRIGVENKVTFFPGVPHRMVPGMLHRLDIYAALSRLDSESFGVAIIEAGACELPVVVSDAQGPSEVVVDGGTGIIVPRNSPEQAANALLKLIENRSTREAYGKSARKHVMDKYTWSASLDLMIDAYEKTIGIRKVKSI